MKIEERKKFRDSLKVDFNLQMDKNYIINVANISNNFEKNNSELKREYLIKNIYKFNEIATLISESKGTFGTGYPFYALSKDLKGKLPIIPEQLRYNNELIKYVEESKKLTWICGTCLPKNYNNMVDLKQKCNKCKAVNDNLKPRKVINRLPDMDMWVVCKDGNINETQKKLSYLLEQNNIHTSDENPFQTIKDMEEIVKDLEEGNMPKKFLPIDAHIIEYSKLKDLIVKVPDILEKTIKNEKVPYLPICPNSYRKTWSYDARGYNFVYDFLASFTEFGFNKELRDVLNNTRNVISKKYTPNELYLILMKSATESNKRRFNTPELKNNFYERMLSWQSKNIKKSKDEFDR